MFSFFYYIINIISYMFCMGNNLRGHVLAIYDFLAFRLKISSRLFILLLRDSSSIFIYILLFFVDEIVLLFD